MTHTLTHHAVKRMNQRGIRNPDIDLLLASADQVAPDAYLMTDVITDQEIERRKREIQQLERLRGKTFIVEGAAVVTAYHAQRRDQKRQARKGRACQ